MTDILKQEGKSTHNTLPALPHLHQILQHGKPKQTGSLMVAENHG